MIKGGSGGEMLINRREEESEKERRKDSFISPHPPKFNGELQLSPSLYVKAASER